MSDPRPAIIAADGTFTYEQLDDASRGFSFRAAGPLDMRMDRSRGRTLAEIGEVIGVCDGRLRASRCDGLISA